MLHVLLNLLCLRPPAPVFRSRTGGLQLFEQTAYTSISLVPISSIQSIDTTKISPSNSLPLVTPDRANQQVRIRPLHH